jgi:Lhr-like helicase
LAGVGRGVVAAHFAYHNARSIIRIDQSLVYWKGLIMDLQENMRAANQRTLEWVTSMHESILDATKSYVASFAKSAPEPPTWTGPQVASPPDLKQLIEDSYDFQARMLEENKKFSLALADAWAAAAPSKSAEQQPEQ